MSDERWWDRPSDYQINGRSVTAAEFDEHLRSLSRAAKDRNRSDADENRAALERRVVDLQRYVNYLEWRLRTVSAQKRALEKEAKAE